MKTKITRKDTRKQLEQFHLASELAKVIRHFFPDLIQLLHKVKDPRNQSYITYETQVLFMVRILSAIFYIKSMRKTSEELNCLGAIKNINTLCGTQYLEEIPHWSTINNFLERLPPEELQRIIPKLIKRLLRMRCFEDSRIRGKYWHILIDGTQLVNEREPLNEKCLTKTHRYADGSVKYVEYYYYVLEAKLVVNENIVLSIATEFVENSGAEEEKQDCELKAAYRLMEKLKKEFPFLPICIGADSLYCGEPFFRKCQNYGWHYLLRFKGGSIPSIWEEYEKLVKWDSHEVRGNTENGERYCCNYACEINYEGIQVSVVRYECEKKEKKNTFTFLTDLSVTKRNQLRVVQEGRRRWRIENEGFNTQKCHGYGLEHRYSEDYNAMKNHYYLIQIGHMIAQIVEHYEKLWKNTRISQEEKHQRILHSFQTGGIEETVWKGKERLQIRLQ